MSLESSRGLSRVGLKSMSDEKSCGSKFGFLMLVCLPPGLGVWALLSLGWGWGIPEPIP